MLTSEQHRCSNEKNGVDPEAYLRHILSVLPEWPSNRVVTNGAIVIHTQRLKSDPGGNLLS